MTKNQKDAIKKVNSALKELYKSGILICGMDDQLLYATFDAIKKDTINSDYCKVANANRFSDEDTGKLYSEGYEDSGGW